MFGFDELHWCSLNLFHNPINFLILLLNFNCLQTARWNPLLWFISELKLKPNWIVSLSWPWLFLYYRIVRILVYFERFNIVIIVLWLLVSWLIQLTKARNLVEDIQAKAASIKKHKLQQHSMISLPSIKENTLD